MKYSQFIGFTAALLLTLSCFLPWAVLPANMQVISGFRTGGTSFGRPGMAHLLFAFIMAAGFLISRVWAKRMNVLVASLNLAWSIRNYILFTGCLMGDCPAPRAGLFLMLISGIVLMFMTLLPRLPVPPPTRP